MIKEFLILSKVTKKNNMVSLASIFGVVLVSIVALVVIFDGQVTGEGNKNGGSIEIKGRSYQQ